MQIVDSLIHAAKVLPIAPANEVLENFSIAVDNGKIIDLLPTQQAKQSYQSKNEHELKTHIVMPGLVNAHTHIAMNIVRGVADDKCLMDWLNNYIWPLEKSLMSYEYTKDGALLAIAELIRGGVTCFNDMYFYPDAVADAAFEAGIRACIGMNVLEFETPYAKNALDAIEKGLAARERFLANPLLKFSIAPHAIYSVSDNTFAKLIELLNQYNLPVHMHVQETQDEVKQSIQETNKRPIQRLAEMELLRKNLIAVHMTQLIPEEIALIATKQVNVVHCPESNAKLASGYCPVVDLLEAGVNVAIGTDGAASNNDLDLFAEMRTAGLLAKLHKQDAHALPVEQLLAMGTINGAKALAWDEQIGSLEIGKQADIVAINMEKLESLPMYYPLSQLIYAMNREQVSDVWVAGKQLLKNRELTTIDEKALIAKANTWQHKVKELIAKK